MFAEDAADQDAHVLSQGPVDGDVAANRLDELAGDVAQGLVAEDLDGAVVDAEGVLERQLVV